MRSVLLLVVLGACFASSLAVMPAHAQTFTDLHDYYAGIGEPYELLQTGLIPQGRDGKLYGISHFAGTSDTGTVFVTDPATGAPTILTSLDTTTGAYPYNGLTLGTDGNFYGTAPLYGSGNAGTVFKVTPAGTLTVLHNFANAGDGGWPTAPPVQGNDGNFYGLASGDDQGTQFPSVFYKVSPTGTFTTLHTFDNTTQGTQCGVIILGLDGNFWGGCNLGGTNNLGTLFKLTPTGAITVLHNFNGTDGTYGAGGMIAANDGNYYGYTYNGGSTNAGVLYRLTPTGVYTVLHQFTTGADGGTPLAAPTLGSDGNLYGTTANGGNTAACPTGTVGCGTIYKLTTGGRFTTLYTFDSTHGAYPESSLTQRTDGIFYGNTFGGGAHGNGVFYSFNTGLQPFVSLVSTSGKVGSKIGILGQGFSHSSVVKFNGVPATSITVTGTTFILATVPAGATTGKVTVTTGTTTLTSSQTFVVHDSWSAGAPIPVAVQQSAAGLLNGKIYLVGGDALSGVTNNNQVYNPTTNSWSTAATLPTAVSAPASAVVSGVLYVIGGYEASSAPSNAVQAYNPTTNSWSAKAPMPTARGSALAVVSQNSIYVIGGNSTTLRLPTVEKYNPSTNTWTEQAPLLVGKSEPAGGLLGSSIVAADGYTLSGDTGDNESYNPTTNIWTSLAPDPTPRNAACSGVSSGLLYVASGSQNGVAESTNESFSAAANKWSSLAAIPQAVIFPASAVGNGLLYCFGGSNVDHGTGTIYNNVQIYQP